MRLARNKGRIKKKVTRNPKNVKSGLTSVLSLFYEQRHAQLQPLVLKFQSQICTGMNNMRTLLNNDHIE